MREKKKIAYIWLCGANFIFIANILRNNNKKKLNEISNLSKFVMSREIFIGARLFIPILVSFYFPSSLKKKKES